MAPAEHPVVPNKIVSRINGSQEDLLERYAVSEICKGWCVYQDAGEWDHYRSLFSDQGAVVWTSDAGPKDIDKFIDLTQNSTANGSSTLYRESGTLVDLAPLAWRAVGKMRATISHRFTLDSIPFDIDADVRLIFFCIKTPKGAPAGSGQWRAKYVQCFYEKDRLIPVDGRSVPQFSEKELKVGGEGYRYLAAVQGRLGNPIKGDLPTRGSENGKRVEQAMVAWLDGEEPELWWEEGGKEEWLKTETEKEKRKEKEKTADDANKEERSEMATQREPVEESTSYQQAGNNSSGAAGDTSAEAPGAAIGATGVNAAAVKTQVHDLADKRNEKMGHDQVININAEHATADPSALGYGTVGPTQTVEPLNPSDTPTSSREISGLSDRSASMMTTENEDGGVGGNSFSHPHEAGIHDGTYYPDGHTKNLAHDESDVGGKVVDPTAAEGKWYSKFVQPGNP